MRSKLSLAAIAASIVMATLLIVHTTSAESAPRRIEVTAKRFTFEPGEITLKKGEPVVLVLKSVDVSHGIRFKELGVETKSAKGQSSELALTPTKTGTFVGQCSVFCGAGHGGMKLTLHVTE